MPAKLFIGWLGIGKSKYYDWQKRYGKENNHNGSIPKSHWLEEWEKEAIIEFHLQYPLEGYRRLCFMMLDRGVVAVSPASVYRVLSRTGLLDRWSNRGSRKGEGFEQPKGPHEHWHVDIAYVNICGTFYYLCSILDGYSRYVVHWEIRESMKERDVEVILQRAREKFPDKQPRIITDNGRQFVSKDFKRFIKLAGMSHVKTSPYYPQSNGKIERWHRTLKEKAIRPKVINSVEEARGVMERFVEHYNEVRLHSAIGYVTPADKLAGREELIWKERDKRLEEAREERRRRWQEKRAA